MSHRNDHRQTSALLWLDYWVCIMASYMMPYIVGQSDRR